MHECTEKHPHKEPTRLYNIKLIGAAEIGFIVNNRLPKDMKVFSLFGGDRISCCDEGLVLTQGENVIGLATIAPYGEGVSITEIKLHERMREYGIEPLDQEPQKGQPTIVGVYVTQPHRRKGYGKTLLEATIARGKERGFERIRVDAVTPEGAKLIQSLPDELKNQLDIYGLEYFIQQG